MAKSSSALRNIRRQRTISQEELSRISGVPHSILSKVECGKMRLRADVEKLLATILGVSHAELFPESDGHTESTGEVHEG